LLLFSIILVSEAWLHEDAFITLRTVDNFVNGYGLRYNIVERVQTYTHPLWMFLLSVPYALTGKPVFATFSVSILVSLVTVFLLLRYLAPSAIAKVVALLILVSSRPFIDYSTSGLENPLTHLLLVVFLAFYFTKADSSRTLFLLTLVAALAGVNRLDTLLFYVPPLFALYLLVPSLRAIALGLLPLIGWVLFSLIYYGFPIPNSAYAKLNVHVPSTDLFRQGLLYFRDLFWRDPLTFLAIFIGLASGLLQRRRKETAVAIGLILYLLYIVRIGGDYMSGRFFTAPLLVAVVLLVRSPWLNNLSRSGAILLVAATLLLGLFSANPVLLPIESERRWRDDHGITDERQFYEEHTGLMQNLAVEPPLERHWLAAAGLQAKEAGQALLIKGGIGLAGYFAGPDVYVLDNYALANTLLSHLPTGNPDLWRIGHFNRRRPIGLEESLISGENELQDAHLADYYDKLLLISRESLFDPLRLQAIWKINTGQYNHLLDPDEYVARHLVHIRQEDVKTPVADGTLLDTQDVITIPYQGIEVQISDLVQPSLIELSLDANYTYRVILLRDGVDLGSVLSNPQPGYDGLRTRRLALPDGIDDQGVDAVRIRPVVRGMDPKNQRALGHLILLPVSDQ
jgi:arabinofuranosyltransferase